MHKITIKLLDALNDIRTFRSFSATINELQDGSIFEENDTEKQKTVHAFLQGINNEFFAPSEHECVIDAVRLIEYIDKQTFADCIWAQLASIPGDYLQEVSYIRTHYMK